MKLAALLVAIIALFTLAIPASAQTTILPNMVSVCTEGSTLTAIPAGTIYQYGTGAGKQYTPSITATATTKTIVISNATFGLDPAPGIVKSLWVQQIATTYNVSCAPPGGVATVVPVPALPVVVTPSTTITLNGSTCSITGSPATGSLTLTFPGVAK